MADDDGPLSRAVLRGGVAATHPVQETPPLALASATADQFNRLKFFPRPIACWSLFDHRFDFDSSFVRPEAKAEFLHFGKLRAKHVGSPISIFGHADDTGASDYNKHLSGRRAKAIYGLLTRDLDGWGELFQFSFGGDAWGVKAEQRMLSALGFYKGDESGALDGPTREAIQAFRGDGGSALDPGARKRLFSAYMDYLCGPDLVLSSSDFLARGLDHSDKHGPRGDVQGCADFNPILIASSADAERFHAKENKAERDDYNAPNRRVLVFLYPAGSLVDFKLWPCPRSTVGVEECKKRFFSDHAVRRQHQEFERTQEKDQKTFGCRFYDRVSNHSLCERTVKLATLSIRLIDDEDNAMASLPYFLQVMGEAYAGVTAADGLLEEEIPADATEGTLTLYGPQEQKVPADDPPGLAPTPEVLWELRLVISDLMPPADDVTGAQNRLNNLGFFTGATATGTLDEQTERALLRFQTRYKIGPVNLGGTLDTETIFKLQDLYGS